MTYLQFINQVLVRMRESEVLTPTDTSYSSLVGLLVNDARKMVETAWDWAGLRSTLTVSATVGTNEYTLTGSGFDYKFLDAYNDTQDSRLALTTQKDMNTKIKLNTAASAAPYMFSLNGLDSAGDQKIIVYPTPDASYTLRFDCVVREADMSAAADTTALPSQPIVLYAWALASRERGETGGTSAQELFALADRSLADSISLEAHKYAAELTWRVN